MSKSMSLSSFDSTLKDYYPAPGTRIKQYVVDQRREDKWERETCPRFHIDVHDDNTGLSCRNAGAVPWTFMSHDCCNICCDLHEEKATDPEVLAWQEERAKRPPVCTDHDKLSDEIAPDLVFRANPVFKLMREP